MMQVVIEISEHYYEILKYDVEHGNDYKPIVLIANGTPLPKEHDIIDGTELNKYLDGLIYAEQKIRLNGYETRTDIIERIKIKADSLTIVEANKGDSKD